MTWVFLEVFYDAFRTQFARQGAILSRDAFASLPVIPTWKPGAAAQLYAMGAEIIGMQTVQPIMPNRPVAGPNGRIRGS